MRVGDLWNYFMRYLGLGLMGLVIASFAFALFYLVIYKNVLKGQKNINYKKMSTIAVFLIYIIMVFGVTLVDRGAYHHGNMNLHFLSSYKEAWHTFTLRSWQFLIFNIILFVPFGFLLPFLYKKNRKFSRTMIFALLFTLSIEIIQYVTGLGIFEVDDIFNNMIGALIGYGLIMFVINIKDLKKDLSAFKYILPLLITVITFLSIFLVYDQQEYGNMPMAYNYQIDMRQVNLDINVVPENIGREVDIYKAPKYNEDETRQFALDFFKRIDIDSSQLSVDAYNDNAMYWIRGNDTYNLRVDYSGGSYSFSDFSMFDLEKMDTHDEDLIKAISSYGISIPEQTKLIHKDIGQYQWVVSMIEENDRLINGTLDCTYYEDHTIKSINYSIITYEKVGQTIIKSTNQVIEDVKSGKFSYHKRDQIENMIINDIDLDYYLDTKGFYRPIYKIESIINGSDYMIHIPAI